MDEEVIYVVVGVYDAEKRFEEFYNQSIFLAKSNALRAANKANLILKTDHFHIRFVPNSRIDMLRGLVCHWAYGFAPDLTRYLELRSSDTMKELKPLVENTDELMRKLVAMEKELQGVD